VDNIITVCIWPSYDWCYIEDLESYLQYHSDDYRTVELPDYATHADIEMEASHG